MFSASKGTSLSSWGLAAGRAAQKYGLADSRDLFREYGIFNYNTSSPYERFPVEKMQHIWKYISQESNDENIGYQVFRFLNPSSFFHLSFALYASQSIRELLHKLVRYKKYLSEQVNFTLEETEDTISFIIHDQRVIQSNLCADVVFCYITQAIRDLSFENISPQQLFLKTKPERTPQQYIDFLNCPVFFGAKDDRICYGRPQADQLFNTADPIFSQHHNQAVEEYLQKLDLNEKVRHRVELMILASLSEGDISINAVADKLNMSVRSLQRHLSNEGNSYQTILEDTRKTLASTYAQDTSLSVTQIAYLLGFAETGNFSKAFKRWNGISFSEYRNLNK